MIKVVQALGVVLLVCVGVRLAAALIAPVTGYVVGGFVVAVAVLAIVGRRSGR